MPKVNKKHKDSVFVSLFRDKKHLLELYNALDINTFSGVLYLDRQNDISFTIDDKILFTLPTSLRGQSSPYGHYNFAFGTENYLLNDLKNTVRRL